MNDFLPKDYKDPKQVSDYMKYADGANKIRILGNPILGWEYWVDEDKKRKPVRVKDFKNVPQEYRSGDDSAKFFWAMLVWNYNDNRAQILEITQVGIRKTIENLSKDPEWGDPKEYDITITKEGEKLETEYTVLPSQPKVFDKSDKYIPDVDLEELFKGGDPFDTSKKIKEGVDEAIPNEELESIAEEIDLDAVKD